MAQIEMETCSRPICATKRQMKSSGCSNPSTHSSKRSGDSNPTIETSHCICLSRPSEDDHAPGGGAVCAGRPNRGAVSDGTLAGGQVDALPPRPRLRRKTRPRATKPTNRWKNFWRELARLSILGGYLADGARKRLIFLGAGSKGLHYIRPWAPPVSARRSGAAGVARATSA